MSIELHTNRLRHSRIPAVTEVERQYSPFLIGWFRWYVRGYLRKHFHGVRISRIGAPPESIDGPVIVVLNHASWWDPLIGVLLSEIWKQRRHFVPIDATSLKKYSFFSKMGFFGIEPNSVPGGAKFLRTALSLIQHDDSMIWITAQGSFTDPRQRPIRLQPGAGHLAAHMERGHVIPLAIEYPFWSERTPEALIHFGEPISIAGDLSLSGQEWTDRIADGLQSAQDNLADLAMSRDPDEFYSALAGKAGVGGIFDVWRRFLAFMTGCKFTPEHGDDLWHG